LAYQGKVSLGAILVKYWLKVKERDRAKIQQIIDNKISEIVSVVVCLRFHQTDYYGITKLTSESRFTCFDVKLSTGFGSIGSTRLTIICDRTVELPCYLLTI